MSYFADHIERVQEDDYENNMRIDIDQYMELTDLEEDFGEKVPRKTVQDRMNPLEDMREDKFR